MKTKTLSLAAGAAVLLFASSSVASTNPVISSSSENSVRISSVRVVRALGGGSYVTGMTEPSFGYVAPRTAHVHVATYDFNGKLLAEKVDKINANNLVRWHLRPRPRAPYTVFFPWEPSQIAKVTVIEHSGYFRHGHFFSLTGLGAIPFTANGFGWRPCSLNNEPVVQRRDGKCSRRRRASF